MFSDDIVGDLLIAGTVAAVIIVVAYLKWWRTQAEFVEVMTYKDAIAYLASNQSLDTRIVKGAMYRAPHLRGYVFTQVFLDNTNNPVKKQDGEPYGRRLIVGRFDSELNDTFSGKDVVIVE